MNRFVVIALVVLCCSAISAQDAPKNDAEAATYVNGPPPDFGHCSKPAIGEKMSTIVHLDITTQGTAAAVGVDQSSGDQCLDDAAIDTVVHYRFRPAMRNGKPVVSHVRMRVDFERKPKS